MQQKQRIVGGSARSKDLSLMSNDHAETKEQSKDLSRMSNDHAETKEQSKDLSLMSNDHAETQFHIPEHDLATL